VFENAGTSLCRTQFVEKQCFSTNCQAAKQRFPACGGCRQFTIGASRNSERRWMSAANPPVEMNDFVGLATGTA
jgi:hypothetical protein